MQRNTAPELENMWVNVKDIFIFLISLKDNYLFKAEITVWDLDNRVGFRAQV